MTNVNKEITQEQFDYLKKIKLHIATPCYGGMCTADYTASMLRFLQLANFLGITVTFETLSNESLISRARNTLVHNFLNETEATHLMFIDADISFGEIDIIKLILAEKEVVGATYPLKRLDWDNLYNNKQTSNSMEEFKNLSVEYVVNVPQYSVERASLTDGNIPLDNGLLEVTGLGTGFVLIERKVFEKLKSVYANDWYLYEDKKHYLFFDTAIEEKTRAYLSEDYFFTRRWLSTGGFAWIDPTIGLTHTGYYRFEGGPLAFPSIKQDTTEEESTNE